MSNEPTKEMVVAQFQAFYKGWRGCTCTPGFPPTDGCPVHDAAADDTDGNKIFEYDCLIIGPDGNGEIQNLSAVGTSHAFTEAEAMFDGKCVAVRRGMYLHENE